MVEFQNFINGDFGGYLTEIIQYAEAKLTVSILLKPVNFASSYCKSFELARGLKKVWLCFRNCISNTYDIFKLLNYINRDVQ